MARSGDREVRRADATQATVRKPADRRLSWPRLGLFLVLLALPGIALSWIHDSFPFVRPGYELVVEDKARMAREGGIFAPGDSRRPRVAVFGSSVALSGFVPRLFEELSGGTVDAYNMGLPGSVLYFDQLESLVRSGQKPTHVVVTNPWGGDDPPRGLALVFNDSALRDAVAPFHDTPRDLVLFALRARTAGGWAKLYDDTRHVLTALREDKGFHFIKSQSHYPNDALPDDFRLPSDRPDEVRWRTFHASGAPFERLCRLARDHGIKVLIVPRYLRRGEGAEPPAADTVAAEQLRAHPEIEVVGPTYWLLPPALFSDPTHTNPAGARDYTARLWHLLADRLQAPASTVAASR